MYKLIVFDLDNTLAALGKGITNDSIKKLKELEAIGIKIAICSGKPVYYLCGLMRQAGISNSILLGENGAVIQFGIDLPPNKYYRLPVSAAALYELDFVRKSLEEMFGNTMWYQPNEVGITPFPKNKQEFNEIEHFIGAHRESLQELDIYRHCDSFDFVPKNISKKTGLEFLCTLLNISSQEIIAVGDGANDYPMFEYAGYSVGISSKALDKTDITFPMIGDALNFLQHKCKE